MQELSDNQKEEREEVTLLTPGKKLDLDKLQKLLNMMKMAEFIEDLMFHLQDKDMRDILDMFYITETDPGLKEAFRQALNNSSSDTPLGDALVELSRRSNFSYSVARCIRLGEKMNTLDSILQSLHDFYLEEIRLAEPA